VFDTPQGHFEIVNKRVNPTWVNPATTTWGKDEPAVIPPGPDNPLGTRAMDLSAPGIRIHGTPDDASIGHWASHGCVRMHIADAEALFDLVDVGTPVIIAW
jgi:L,D-transpeptidase ErfK/SrfK